jgi:RNA polymerase sigma factor (sigma-70 family)
VQQFKKSCVFIKKKQTFTLELTASLFYDDQVEKCKQGSHSGYKMLYMQYSKAMFNTSLRIVNNMADAEDILQESFTDAFKSLERFNYQSTFGAWLKRIVINKSINHLRDKKFKLVDINQVSIPEFEDEEPIDEEEIKFKVEEIKKAVTILPEGYRTVFTLYAFEGYDYDEIAEILGITTSTVRTQYHRARKQLLLFIIKKKLS